ncbi:MAG: hypothetical protein AAGB26_01925 [Planctomycetota bacterium]
MYCVDWQSIDTILAFGSLTRVVPWWGWLIVVAVIGLVYGEVRKW